MFYLKSHPTHFTYGYMASMLNLNILCCGTYVKTIINNLITLFSSI